MVNLAGSSNDSEDAITFPDGSATPPEESGKAPKAEAPKKEEPKPEAAPVPAASQSATPAPSTQTPPDPNAPPQAALDASTEAEIEARCPWPKDKADVAEYRKAWLHQQKDAARLAKNWKDHTTQKEATRAEIAKAQQELARQREEIEAKANTYSPEDYEAAADSFTKKGQADLAAQAREAAARLRAGRGADLANVLGRQRQEQQQRAQLWEQSAAQAAVEYPELADANSAAIKAAKDALQQLGLAHHPQGPLVAARIAKERLTHQATASELAGMKDRLAAAEAEANRLRGLMALPGSQGPTVPSKPANAIPSDQQMAELMRQLDAAGVPL